MYASSYLQSLEIELKPADSPKVGRLSIVAEFEFNKQRGVVIRPKRGGVSPRYIEMLASQGVDFVVVDGAVPFSIYGRSPGEAQLEPLRALPIICPSAFPSPEIFDIFIELIQKTTRRPDEALDFGSRIFVAKIEDEETGAGQFSPALSSIRNHSSLSKFIETGFDLKLPGSAVALDAIATILSLLAGYRLSPESEEEAALLIEFVARLAAPKAWGLPHQFAFAVTGPWDSGGNTVIASAALGVQFLPLRTSQVSQAFFSLPSSLENPLLRKLFPNTRFMNSDFLSWSPSRKDEPPNRLFVVPPFGRWVTSAEILANSELRQHARGKEVFRAPTETLYIEHALKIAQSDALVVAAVPEGLLSSVGHAEFRNWLLERSQLLAVLSLPVRSCFAGAAIRCSILYLKKTATTPNDYPILMLEIDEDDLGDSEAMHKIGAAIAKAIKGEAFS